MSQIFNQTKYTKWYELLMTRAKSARRHKGTIYYENHHIIPRSLGGKNNTNNLVLLTAKEHYIAHLLLTKMCIELVHRRSMAYAFHRMVHCGRYKVNAKLYETFRIDFSKRYSGINHFNYGKKASLETRKKQSIARAGEKSYMFGVPKTSQHRRKISNTRKRLGIAKGQNNPNYGAKTFTEETYQKMSLAKVGLYDGIKNPMFGKTRIDLAERNRNIPPNRASCVVCRKETIISVLNRDHKHNFHKSGPQLGQPSPSQGSSQHSK